MEFLVINLKSYLRYALKLEGLKKDNFKILVFK